jgi:hypothetical protein
MKRALLCGTMIVASIGICFAGETNLWDDVLNVVLAHIKRDGPTSEAAQFISMAQEQAWTRRTEIEQLVTPVLSDPSPDKVIGALEVLYRVRGYHPMSYLSGGGRDFESDYATFFTHLDQQVFQSEGFDYLRDAVLNNPKSLDRIRQWALDYLYLPPGQSTKEQGARQIESQKRQRATGQKN